MKQSLQLSSPLIFNENVQMPVLNSSPYELVKKGLLSLLCKS